MGVGAGRGRGEGGGMRIEGRNGRMSVEQYLGFEIRVPVRGRDWFARYGKTVLSYGMFSFAFVEGT